MFFDVFSTESHLLHSTVHNFTFPLILTRFQLLSVQSEQLFCHFAIQRLPLNITTWFAHFLILFFPLFKVCYAFFPFSQFFYPFQALLCLLFPSLMIIHLHLSLLHLKPLTSARQLMDLLFPPLKKESAPKSLLCLQVHLNHFSVSTRARANRRACGTHKYA